MCRYLVTPTQDMFVIHVYFKLKIISIGFCSFMLFFLLIVNCREDKASRLQASKMAIVTIFRSWSGQYPRVDDALNSHFCICDAMISQILYIELRLICNSHNFFLVYRYGNSLYCLPNNPCGVSLENLVLDQPSIPELIFFFVLITYLYILCNLFGSYRCDQPLSS